MTKAEETLALEHLTAIRSTLDEMTLDFGRVKEILFWIEGHTSAIEQAYLERVDGE